MHPNTLLRFQDQLNRRTFLAGSATGLGLAALGSLTANASPAPKAKAKRVIYLFQSGAPSQMDLFDPKPGLEKVRGEDLPASIRMGQRLTGMTSGQAKFPVAPSIFKFAKHGQSGQWFCELLPQTAKWADKIAVIKSMQTNAINHDPAITFFQTGQEIAGRPSIGSWLAYGLGSENADLPAYIVLTSQGSGRPADQPLYDRLWGSGFLPTRLQGVKLRNQGDPVLYLSDPPGIDRGTRREMLDELGELNKLKLGSTGDPEIATRIAQYEMAFRMQTSVPALTDLSKEPAKSLEAYGPDVKRPGSYAYNCLLARRLSERGVRFVQLFHMGWDHHGGLPPALRGQCRDTDTPTAALLKDLEARGLLDETLIVWGGEFGRTVYSQGALTATNYGRDHHPKCFSVWLAGGGIKGGVSHGETDDYCYNVTKDPVQVRDLHATILHLMGIDHDKLTYKFQGLDAKLTGVEPAKVVNEILA
ncbi:MAG: sulfatase [Planctomycetaceae bacterium]|nr:sulfatase [Planctomycetaceae bacterium]